MTTLPILVKMTVNPNKMEYQLGVSPSKMEYQLGNSMAINVVQHDVPNYEGPYQVTPLARDAVVLETQGLRCTDDITVLKIPTFDARNEYGTTFYIREVNNGN